MASSRGTYLVAAYASMTAEGHDTETFKAKAQKCVEAYHCTLPLGTSRDYSVLVDAVAAALADAAHPYQALCLEICGLDAQLEQIPGEDGFVKGYKMNTGAWHRILALARARREV